METLENRIARLEQQLGRILDHLAANRPTLGDMPRIPNPTNVDDDPDDVLLGNVTHHRLALGTELMVGDIFPLGGEYATILVEGEGRVTDICPFYRAEAETFDIDIEAPEGEELRGPETVHTIRIDGPPIAGENAEITRGPGTMVGGEWEYDEDGNTTE